MPPRGTADVSDKHISGPLGCSTFSIQPFGAVQSPLAMPVLPWPDRVSFPSYIQLPKVPTHRKTHDIPETINIPGIYNSASYACTFVTRVSLLTSSPPLQCPPRTAEDCWVMLPLTTAWNHTGPPGSILSGEGLTSKAARGHRQHPKESCLSSPCGSVFPGEPCPCLKSKRHCKG